MRLSRKIGIIEDAEQRVLDAGFVKSAQQKDSVAAPTAARIVGDIGKDKGRQRGVPADRERLLHGFVERSQPGRTARG